MSRSFPVRYKGVLNPVGRRLLQVCYEPLRELEEMFERKTEEPVKEQVQVPDEPDVYAEYHVPSLWEDD